MHYMIIQLLTTYERHQSPKFFCFRRNGKLHTLIAKTSTSFQSNTNEGKIEQSLVTTSILKSAGMKTPWPWPLKQLIEENLYLQI